MHIIYMRKLVEALNYIAQLDCLLYQGGLSPQLLFYVCCSIILALSFESDWVILSVRTSGWARPRWFRRWWDTTAVKSSDNCMSWYWDWMSLVTLLALWWDWPRGWRTSSMSHSRSVSQCHCCTVVWYHEHICTTNTEIYWMLDYFWDKVKKCT